MRDDILGEGVCYIHVKPLLYKSTARSFWRSPICYTGIREILEKANNACRWGTGRLGPGTSRG
jgi:hypothetical protein